METKKTARSRFNLYIGKEVSEKMFERTHNVDVEAYPAAAQVDMETKLRWFRQNPETHIVFYDEAAREVVGYLAVYPVKPSFAMKYVKGKIEFSEIKPKNICKFKNHRSYYLYGWSCAILPKYQGQPIKDLFERSTYDGEKVFKILNEGFVELLCRLAERGIYIDKMFGEGYSKKGEEYMKELRLVGIYENKKVKSDIFLGNFHIEAYSKCRNYPKLVKAYSNIKR